MGTEEVANRSAYHLRVEDFTGVELPDSDVDFEPSGASIWIDTEQYVPLRMLVEGRATVDGTTDQLEDMDAQLEGLSESQKEMIMGRLAPQIAQLERMARGEPLTVVTNVVEVRVNEGPPFDLAEIVFGGR